MKKTLKIIICFLLAISFVFPIKAGIYASALQEHPFSDVEESDWYEGYVQYVWTEGLFNGVTETEFSPSGILTRSMFVVVLGRLAKIDPEYYNWKVLGDVNPTDWYSPYVTWAFDNAITQSMGNDDFRPDYHVTREQIATFISRFLKKYYSGGLKSAELNYNDKDKITNFAVEGIGMCLDLGIMQGDEQGNFRPQDKITRAEAAAVVTRLHKLIYESL